MDAMSTERAGISAGGVGPIPMYLKTRQSLQEKSIRGNKELLK
jgi:hypothetical protein